MITEKDHRNLKVLRSLDAAECDEIADYIEKLAAERSVGDDKFKADPRAGQKVDRTLLRMWGEELPNLGFPSRAMGAAAETAKLSREMAELMHTKNWQNELTTTAMFAAVDFACVPKAGEVSEGSPDLSGLT